MTKYRIIQTYKFYVDKEMFAIQFKNWCIGGWKYTGFDYDDIMEAQKKVNQLRLEESLRYKEKHYKYKVVEEEDEKYV